VMGIKIEFDGDHGKSYKMDMFHIYFAINHSHRSTVVTKFVKKICSRKKLVKKNCCYQIFLRKDVKQASPLATSIHISGKIFPA
jgi:hypothetical protein